MEKKLVSKESILATVARRSNQNRPEPMIFEDFDTFLAWRFEHIDDISMIQMQEVPALVLVPVLKKPEIPSQTPEDGIPF